MKRRAAFLVFAVWLGSITQAAFGQNQNPFTFVPDPHNTNGIGVGTWCHYWDPWFMMLYESWEISPDNPTANSGSSAAYNALVNDSASVVSQIAPYYQTALSWAGILQTTCQTFTSPKDDVVSILGELRAGYSDLIVSNPQESRVFGVIATNQPNGPTACNLSCSIQATWQFSGQLPVLTERLIQVEILVNNYSEGTMEIYVNQSGATATVSYGMINPPVTVSISPVSGSEVMTFQVPAHVGDEVQLAVKCIVGMEANVWLPNHEYGFDQSSFSVNVMVTP